MALPLCHSSTNLVCQLCHGSSLGELSLSELSLPLIHYVGCWCLPYCLLSAFRFLCGCHAQQWGLNCWGLHCQNTMGYTLGRLIFLLVIVCDPCQECPEWLLPPLLLLLIQLPPSHSIYMVGHKALGTQQSHLILQPSLHVGEGSSFPGCVHFMIWWTPNQWWMWNLLILLWFVGF